MEYYTLYIQIWQVKNGEKKMEEKLAKFLYGGYNGGIRGKFFARGNHPILNSNY